MTGVVTTEFTNSRTREALAGSIIASSPAMPITVADVRWNTYYPLNGEFRPAALGPWLKRYCIGYAYYQGLGNPFKDMADVAEMERKYKEYAVSQPDFASLISSILDGAGTFCLLCYCKPPKPCHRYWLKELIESRIGPGARPPGLF